MDLAALPAGAGEHSWDRGLQPGVSVGDHQAHTAEATQLQRAQEAPPEHFVLGVADVDAEHFSFTDGGDPGGDHHSHRDDPVVAPDVR